MAWYLIYTKPRQEIVALENLERQGFNVYLPLYKKLKKPAKNAINQEITIVHEPLFARYLFVQPSHPEQSLSTVQYTRGVVCMVRFGTNMASVPQQLIDDMRAFEKSREESSLEELSPLKLGTRVRLNRHSGLEHLEGLIQNSSAKRVTVLLEIMSAPTTKGHHYASLCRYCQMIISTFQNSITADNIS
ncbi:Transcription antitermination protein RfaH [Oligella ureolytica]